MYADLDRLWDDLIETLEEGREAIIENEKTGFYLCISHDHGRIITETREGEVVFYNSYHEIFAKYNITREIFIDHVVEMY